MEQPVLTSFLVFRFFILSNKVHPSWTAKFPMLQITVVSSSVVFCVVGLCVSGTNRVQLFARHPFGQRGRVADVNEIAVALDET